MDLRSRHVPRRRVPAPTETHNQAMAESRRSSSAMMDFATGEGGDDYQDERQKQRRHRVWLAYAIASGICAAFNGVFAKLTTTKLTANLSSAIAAFLGIPQHENIIQLLCRTVFFLLNLLFNGIMWTFFTTALKKSTSATQVAVMNTSTNFLVTAFAGLIIFSESLPPMWWAGASLLVAGSVIAGRRDQQSEEKDEAELEVAAAEVGEHRGLRRDGDTALKPYRDDANDDEDVPHLDGL